MPELPPIRRRDFVSALATTALAAPLAGSEFRSAWPAGVESDWLGPEYWANPLQEWRIRNGRIENTVAGGDRNVYLLTREIAATPGRFTLAVETGRMEEDRSPLGEGFAGFRVGIRGHFGDYRDSAVRGEGLNAGITHEGRLFIGKVELTGPRLTGPLSAIRMELAAAPEPGGAYTLTLRVVSGEQRLELTRGAVAAGVLTGGMALVSSSGPIPETPHPLTPMVPNGGTKPGTARGGNLRFWFRNWTVTGDQILEQDARAFGPVLFAMHTLSRRVLKLTVQMAPVPENGEPVRLETRREGQWVAIASSPVDRLSRTAHFRLENWNDAEDTPYRVRYTLRMAGATDREDRFEGVIRKDPRDKPRLVIGALTCNNDFGFPHREITRHVAHFEPDVLLFTGDQIYERVGEYGIQMAPLEESALDYLRKWYLFGWAWRDLLRSTPTVAIPDDHDVYHGNVWGAGGRKAEAPEIYTPAGTGTPAANRNQMWQDSGGYKMPAAWVNVVQRTQTSHLPDPFDPAPAEQGIGVYYTSMLYGGVSFAILEDRKWKSAPVRAVPEAKIRNGWAQNPAYDAAKDGDVEGAELLGERQLRFLEAWAQDWSGGAFLKMVVSQTIFANVATLPPPANTDGVTPGLPVLGLEEYAEGEVMVADHDSNGWPQTPRNRALRLMRKALAVHVGGDQHLGSTVQYGIEEFADASWAICTPAISNLFPRRWYPPERGQGGKSRNTGAYRDGFGNRVTVHAVANPARFGVEPATLYNRAPGYGILEIDRHSRRIRLANWPRWVDPSQPEAKPYPGWPIEIHQLDNGLSSARWTLDPVPLEGFRSPVVQVIEEEEGEITYTVRVPEGGSFTPRVWKEGRYVVRIFEPETGKEERLAGLSARPV